MDYPSLLTPDFFPHTFIERIYTCMFALITAKAHELHEEEITPVGQKKQL